MLISIITPTFNSSENIEKCIRTIIQQSYKEFEHIIIDNLSTDDTLTKAKNIYSDNNLISKLRIISEKDNGISDAFNKGIRLAKGDVINILNSDDYYFANNIFEKVIEAFKNQSILFVHGNILFIDETYGSNIRRPLLCNIKKAMPFNHPTMFVSKKLYDQTGGYDNNYKYAMDFDFVCKVKDTFDDLNSISFYIQGDPITVMRAGGASWMNESKSIEEIKKILIRHKLWDSTAKTNYFLRLFRVRIKTILSFVGLNYFIKVWRKNKWKSSN